MIINVTELVKGDEVMIEGELHRITVSEPSPENETMTLSYVIERPRTAPFRKWWFNVDNVEVLNR
jgi:hypothetical protein